MPVTRASRLLAALLVLNVPAGSWVVLDGFDGAGRADGVGGVGGVGGGQGMASPTRPPRPVARVETDLPAITVAFEDVAERAGLTAPNVAGSEAAKKYILETT